MIKFAYVAMGVIHLGDACLGRGPLTALIGILHLLIAYCEVRSAGNRHRGLGRRIRDGS